MTGTIQLSSLDHHFSRFINRIDQSPCEELRLAAALTSAAVARGHVCLDLAAAASATILPFRSDDTLPSPPADRWQEILSGCSSVGQPGDYTPLVLDRRGRLYLHRSWDYERRVTASILARLDLLPVDGDLLAQGLARWFPPCGESPDWQAVAAVAAVVRRFTVISGGPGTGKTSTVARILALLIEQNGERNLRIALAAPTGKAAMRLRQSLLQATQRLDLPDHIRTRLPVTVQTIHRLLGISSSNATRYHHDYPLPCDLLVVDEVSMVDLPLMARLLDALPASARLILLGDRDQLASVDAGAVLADICNHGCTVPFSAPFGQVIEATCGSLPEEMVSRQEQTAPLGDAVIHLRTSYRFGSDSGIGQLSRLINAGRDDEALELLTGNNLPDVRWRPLPETAAFASAFAAAAREGYAPYAQATDPAGALEALEHFRVLSPFREGPYGITALNDLIRRALGVPQAVGAPGRLHQAVMVTGNNYEAGLFNGDTAVVFPSGNDRPASAYFADPEKGVRHLSFLRLPPCEAAFAVTVHKSQGSEFERVLLILPERASELVSRELLYTAITRARSTIEVWCDPEVFRSGIERRIARNSGLREALWGA